jgi:hypothetical protein
MHFALPYASIAAEYEEAEQSSHDPPSKDNHEMIPHHEEHIEELPPHIEQEENEVEELLDEYSINHHQLHPHSLKQEKTPARAIFVYLNLTFSSFPLPLPFPVRVLFAYLNSRARLDASETTFIFFPPT